MIGEGIETQEQCEALQNLGCGMGQGFLYAHPRSVDDMIRGI